MVLAAYPWIKKVTIICAYISAVKWLIVINRNQNKFLFT